MLQQLDRQAHIYIHTVVIFIINNIIVIKYLLIIYRQSEHA